MNKFLRPMTESDLELVLAWRNSDSVRMNMYSHDLISWEDHVNWFETQKQSPHVRNLIFELDSNPLGVVSFSQISLSNSSATWAFYSGDTSVRGVGSMMETLALDYAFNELKINRLECEVLEFNSKVISFHKKFGFQEEGRKKQGYCRDGEYFDIVQLSILQSDYNRGKHYHGEKSFIGESYTQTKTFTAEAVTSFANITGDNNPIHLSDVEAKKAGFAGRIVHGMLISSVFSKIFAEDLPGPGTVFLSNEISFHRAVLIDDNMTFKVKVITHIARLIVVDMSVEKDGQIYASGTAKLMLKGGAS